MFKCMRTTISIEDNLLKEAKKVSLKRNCTLGEVVNDALRQSLVSGKKTVLEEGSGAPLKTFKGSGIQPGVDLDDSASLMEVMEG